MLVTRVMVEEVRQTFMHARIVLRAKMRQLPVKGDMQTKDLATLGAGGRPAALR